MKKKIISTKINKIRSNKHTDCCTRNMYIKKRKNNNENLNSSRKMGEKNATKISKTLMQKTQRDRIH